MNCIECKQRLYPDNPEVSFHGLQPLCHSCPNWDGEKQPEVIYKPHYIPVEPEAYKTELRKLKEEIEGLRNYVIKQSQAPPLKKKSYKYISIKNNNKEDA